MSEKIPVPKVAPVSEPGYEISFEEIIARDVVAPRELFPIARYGLKITIHCNAEILKVLFVVQFTRIFQPDLALVPHTWELRNDPECFLLDRLDSLLEVWVSLCEYQGGYGILMMLKVQEPEGIVTHQRFIEYVSPLTKQH